MVIEEKYNSRKSATSILTYNEACHNIESSERVSTIQLVDMLNKK